jgi:hypothetical protein
MPTFLLKSLDFKQIWVEHKESFTPYRSQNVDNVSFFTYLLCPLIPAIIIGSLPIKADSDLITVFITLYSIFCGLLFSFIVLLKAEHKGFSSENTPELKKLVEYTYSNVSFSILLSMVSIFLLLTFHLLLNLLKNEAFKKGYEPRLIEFLCNSVPVFLGAVTYLTTLFLLTLNIILNNLHEICRPSKNSSAD